MKTHLKLERYGSEYHKPQCNNSVALPNMWFTDDYEQVTCKLCEKTLEYKRLESKATENLKQEVM